MSDLTLAEKISRTTALYAELVEMWGDDMPHIGLHHRSHEEIHGCGRAATVFLSNGRPVISATLGNYPFGPQLYGDADPTCETCRDAAVGIAALVNAEATTAGSTP